MSQLGRFLPLTVKSSSAALCRPTGNDPPDILHSLDQERTLVSFVKMLDLREAIARTALDHVTHIGRVCRIGEDYILDVLGVH